MTIYIDVVILENLIMNYIILYATAIIVKKKASIFRLLMSSMLRSNLCNNIIYIPNSNIFIYNLKNSIINSYGLYSIWLKNIKGVVQAVTNFLHDFFCIWGSGIIFNTLYKTTRSINSKWSIYR